MDPAESLLPRLRRAVGEGYELVPVRDAAAAMEALAHAEAAVLVAGPAGVELLQSARETSPFLQVLLVADAGGAPGLGAVAPEQGVQVLGSPSDAGLGAAVASAVELHHLRADNARLSRLARQNAEDVARLSGEVEAQVASRTHSLSSATQGWERTFDSLDLPLAVVGADFGVERANAAYVRAARRSTRELDERPRCHSFLFGRATPCPGCPLSESLANGREGRAEIQHQERTYAMSVNPMDPSQAVCSYRDVADERSFNRRLMHSEKMAAVGRLAGGVAHEINNPLGGILAFSQLMQRDKGRSAEDLESLSLIEESALRCKRIVESLLRFARASRGEDRRPFNLSRCVEDAAILFRAQMKSAPKARMELELADALPEVEGDPARLAQVVLNLLQNGLDSLPRTEGVLTVQTGEHDGRVFFRVKDTGAGIPQKDLPHIFEPTFTTRQPGEGTGLGLSIAYRIVEDHRGSFEVDTVPGKGSSFTVTLPVPPT